MIKSKQKSNPVVIILNPSHNPGQGALQIIIYVFKNDEVLRKGLTQVVYFVGTTIEKFDD